MIERPTTKVQRDMNLLTTLKRNHYLPGTDEKEDDSSHSMSVAMIAWALHEQVAPHLSLEKILKYSLIHDFVEIHAGDVNTFASQEARAQKMRDEQAALLILRADYIDQPDLIGTIDAYETRTDDESQFVWTCDKIQGLEQGQLDNWRCYYEYGVTDEMFAAKCREFVTKCHPTLQNFLQELVEHCISSFHNPYTE